MKTPLFITFVLFLFAINLFDTTAQSNSINSLQNFVKSINNDTARVATMIELSQKYMDSDPDKSFKYGFDALVLATHHKYSRWQAESYNNLGDLYWYKSDYVSSEAHYSEAFKIFERLNDKVAIANSYRNLGWIYHSKANYKEALNLHKKALLINLELGLKKESGNNYNDIGTSYSMLTKFDSAMENYCEGLEILKSIDSKNEMSSVYSNIAIVYSQMGNNLLLIENAVNSFELAKDIGNKRYEVNAYELLATLYKKSNDIKKAVSFFQKAVDVTKELKDKSALKNLFTQLSTLYAETGDYKKALEYTELSVSLADSIFDEENSRQRFEMNKKYESEKKLLAINNLEKDKTIAHEKLDEEKKSKTYLMVFCFVIIVFAFILYWNNSQKQKVNQALSIASDQIEEKNKSITDSIHYAWHIQDVCLPPKDLKYKIFGKIFILFQPKDIVSGDFYWYTEKNGKRLIACCDCTGHGVPGALMSMIGNNILNKIVNERGITSPDEILRSLHKEIRNTLKQEEKSASKDGMDIAIVVFNSATEIEFAGAHRPLWIIKPNTKVGNNKEESTTGQYELVEIKPDKLSIGGHQTETERMFTKHKLQLTKGDSLYLFSDGYTDQFGGEKEKKYTSKRFKELLFNICNKPVNEQEVVLKETINSWRGKLDQIDDILVIGIKI